LAKPSARWRVARAAAVGVIALAILPVRAAGQACTSGDGRYKVKVQPRVVAFPLPSLADFEVGWVLADPMTVRVIPRGKAFRGWELCIRSDDPDMGGYGKPISDLEWRIGGTGAWQPLTSGNQLVAAGYSNETVSVELRARLDWERDVPDTYSAAVTFVSATL